MEPSFVVRAAASRDDQDPGDELRAASPTLVGPFATRIDNWLPELAVSVGLPWVAPLKAQQTVGSTLMAVAIQVSLADESEAA